jgi:hypothetical protein
VALKIGCLLGFRFHREAKTRPCLELGRGPQGMAGWIGDMAYLEASVPPHSPGTGLSHGENWPCPTPHPHL